MRLDITGTESEQNVREAFACESQARNRYTYFATQARNEGDEQVAELFEAMADNEREHAKVWYKVLHGSMRDIRSNLEDAACQEHAEWEFTYPRFAEKAREEGFELLAIMFENIAAIEKNHEALFLEMLAARTAGTTQPPNDTPTSSHLCKYCGYRTQTILTTCPVCGQADCFA